MNNREQYLDKLVERTLEKRYCTLAEIIESEKLDTYELGYEDYIYADAINFAVVPCEEFMIIAHEHIDKDTHESVAEYAVYIQHDRDGRNLRNSLNMNAVYRLDYVGEETFTNMAYAIAHAAGLIHTLTENDRNMEVDPS